MEIEYIKKEMDRVKGLQGKLKEDIRKYKTLVNKDKCEFTEKERFRLVENFNHRLRQNQWILKKVINKLSLKK